MIIASAKRVFLTVLVASSCLLVCGIGTTARGAAVRAGPLDRYPCAPLDIVFLLDTTGSMAPAIRNVQREIVQVLSEIDSVSGGDYRVGVVDFSDDGITVDASFGVRNADETTKAVTSLSVPSEGGKTSPEMWDEALATIVDTRTSAELDAQNGSGQQAGDFDVDWRPDAEKIVVLVADSSPGGFDQEYQRKDMDHAYEVAVRAKTRGIRVATIMVPHLYRDEGAEDFLRAVSDLTASSFQATLPDASNLAEGLRLNVKTCATDTDGDGLFDTWEKEGYDGDGDGKVDVNLPKLGANPRHKDLFLQVNWMAVDGARPCLLGVFCLSASDDPRPPDPDALKRAVEMFADAPVQNPDGSGGIALHIDAGPLSTSGNFDTSSARGGPMTYSRPRLLEDTSCGGIMSDYDRARLNDLKAEYVPAARSAVFTWAMYARRIAGSGCLGLAPGVPGDTFLISGSLVKSTLPEAATFVHELGHTLGLRHGGLDDVNGKPNYLSIMNYDYTLGNGLIKDGKAGTLDYSRFDLAPLDQSAGIDESVGVQAIPGSTDPDGYGLAYHCAGGEGGRADLRTVTSLVPVDWDCDGDVEDTQITASVARNGESSDDGVLTSRNDWSSITFTGGARGGLATVGEPVDEQGLDYSAWRSERKDYAVEVFDPGAVAVNSGALQVRLVVTLRNVGEKADTYEVSVTGKAGKDLKAGEERVQVAAGETAVAAIDVPLADAGLKGDGVPAIQLSVRSEAAPWVGATRVVSIRTAAVDPLPSDGILDANPADPTAGQTVVVSGDGFVPHSPVVVVSDRAWFDPISVQADASGSVTTEVPAAAQEDRGTVTAVGIAADEALPEDGNPADSGDSDAPTYDGSESVDEEQPVDLVPPDQQSRVLSADITVKPPASRIPLLATSLVAIVILLLCSSWWLVRRSRHSSDRAADGT